jgi:uncharacterized protein (DUF1015 family)
LATLKFGPTAVGDKIGGMASLIPFRALRPARQLANGHPLSFLHTSRAEIDLPNATDPYSELVYETARHNFQRLRQQAPLVVDDEPAAYLYRLQMGDHVQTGVAACFSLDEYDRDVIKKHERTRRDKEDDRTRHMVEIRAQTGPVFLTYRASPAADDLVAHAAKATPLYDFAAADGVRHTLWRVPPAETSALVEAFAAIPELYIADGHHRAASAARARQALKAAGNGTAQPCDAFLAVAFPHDQVAILPYNRVVKDLNGLRPGEVLEKLRTTHRVEPGPAVPQKKGEEAVFIAGHWYTLTLKGHPNPRSPIDRLDVSALQEQVLGPLLNIGDPRVDKRIDFVGGARGTQGLERAVGSGAAAIAFSMYPVSVSDLMAISDAGDIMPPKSTWFEPKLRDGLLIHEI